MSGRLNEALSVNNGHRPATLPQTIRFAACGRGLATLPMHPHPGTSLGTSLALWGVRTITVPLRRRTLLVGGTGTGKSALMRKLIQADLEAGHAAIVIDPHGELVDDILASLPLSRTNDLCWWDPLDKHPIGLNPLEGGRTWHDKVRRLEQTLVVLSDLYGDGSWLGQSAMIGRNVGMAIMEAEKSPTLLHLIRFFSDPAYAEWIAGKVRDPAVKAYFRTVEGWDKRQQAQAEAPPRNKVDALASSPLLRDIVGQEHGFDFGRAMNTGKVVLCRFSKGVLGEEGTSLLASLVVSKVLFAALERQAQRNRPHASLYIDEIAATMRGNADALQQLLQEGRKYGVSVSGACQGFTQLGEKATEALLANVETKVVGRVSHADAERLSRDMGLPGPQVLTSLPNHRFVMKAVRDDGFVTDPILFDSDPPVRSPDVQDKRIALQKSRAHWGVPREEVERRVARLLGGPFHGTTDRRKPSHSRRAHPRRARGQGEAFKEIPLDR